MKRSTLVLLVAAILVVGALYYLWRTPAAPAPGAPPDLVSLLPPDASYLLYANAAALRASPFIQELLRQLPASAEDRDYQEFVAATGFDYARDLDRLAVAIHSSEGKDSAMALADGRFDRQKISDYSLKSGQRMRQGGYEGYIITTGNPPKTAFLFFLNDTRISLSEGAPLHRLSEMENSSPLGERVTRVAAAEVFAIARVGKIPSHAIPEGWASKEIMETLQSVSWVTFAARPAGNDMNVVLEAECETPGSARKLSWGLEGLRLLIRMSLSDPKSRQKMDPVVTALLEVITRDGKITSADRYVRLSFVLTPQFLAAIKAPRSSPQNGAMERTSPPPAEKARSPKSPAPK